MARGPRRAGGRPFPPRRGRLASPPPPPRKGTVLVGVERVEARGQAAVLRLIARQATILVRIRRRETRVHAGLPALTGLGTARSVGLVDLRSGQLAVLVGIGLGKPRVPMLLAAQFAVDAIDRAIL